MSLKEEKDEGFSQDSFKHKFGHKKKRFLSDDKIVLLTKAPTKPGPSKSLRRELLLKKVKEEGGNDLVSMCPERDDRFFSHPDCKRVGLVFVRPYYWVLKETWFIYLMKLSYFERGEDRDCSHFKVSYRELPQIIDILEELLSEIAETKCGHLTDRLEKSPFKSNNDRKDVGEFWSKSHTLYLESQRLAVRQYMDAEGIWTLKFFAPKQTSYEDWFGSTMTMSLGHCRELIRILKNCEDYIRDHPVPVYDETD